MKILIIGSGAREHTLVWKFTQSSKVSQIFASPGNCGMENLAQLIQLETQKDILRFVDSEGIDITFVGPEQPLAEGIVDEFKKAGKNIIGPSKFAAEIESSKIFAKNFMKKYHIPTSRFQAFDNISKALNYIFDQEFPLVIKTDGLAGGKGVFICNNYTDAEIILNHLMHYNILGKAGHKIIVENFLQGEEASLFAFCDGKHFVSTILSQDHKQLNDGDKGPNTGGMGAYAPAIFPEIIKKEIEDTIIIPTLYGMNEEHRPFVGILYAGIMVTNKGPQVLEFNCRLGDPEAQVILPLLENDLVDICNAIIQKKINEVELKWKNKSAVTVVLASKGYPGKYEKGKKISGTENISDKDIMLFFSGVKCKNSEYFTNGGRVLSVTAIADNLINAKEKTYNSLKYISFDGMYFRNDIAQKGIKKLLSDK